MALVEFLRARLDDTADMAQSGVAAESYLSDLGELLLRGVERDRRIVDLHSPIDRPSRQDYDPDVERCRTCAAHADGRWRRFTAPCPTLRLLAMPYADHPDYQQEWALTPA